MFGIQRILDASNVGVAFVGQVESLRPGEVGIELQAVCESPLRLHVQTVIAFGASRLISQNLAEIRILGANSAGTGREPGCRARRR